MHAFGAYSRLTIGGALSNVCRLSRRFLTGVVVLTGAAWACAPAYAGAETTRLTPVGTFDAPIWVTAPERDGRRLHVVERAGKIRVVRNGVTLAQPFLDITADVDDAGEGGLLSMAFPPSYRRRGYFYVFLTPKDATPGALPHAPIEVREYRRSRTDPDRADPASARTVLTIPHASFANHYGGQLQFGPDGLLYVSTGDGGGGDPQGNAQNTASRLGKLLRLDPRPDGSAADGSTQYHAPWDNPFARNGGDALVWSYGLRNPFRFSFDRRTGDLTIGDVGQSAFEEVDFARAGWRGAGRGANFGWNRCEGPLSYPVTQPEKPCTFPSTLPVHSYRQVQGSCSSITGGLVVRDRGLERLKGRYIYGDFCRGFVNSLKLATPTATGDASTGLSVPLVAAFGEDACRRVYVVQLTGSVSRLEDASPRPCRRTVHYP